MMESSQHGRYKAKKEVTLGMCLTKSLTIVTYPFCHSFPDKVRGILNEGGLFGERQGWHLPGFDASKWVRRPLSAGLPSGKSGIGFFVTTFDLSIPQEKDVNLSFQFGEKQQAYRALLFVNGWQFGKVHVLIRTKDIIYSHAASSLPI